MGEELLASATKASTPFPGDGTAVSGWQEVEQDRGLQNACAERPHRFLIHTGYNVAKGNYADQEDARQLRAFRVNLVQ